MNSKLLRLAIVALLGGVSACTTCGVRNVVKTCYETPGDCSAMHQRSWENARNDGLNEEQSLKFADLCAVGCVSRDEGYSWARVRRAIEPLCQPN